MAVVHTIGHGTRTSEELIEMLQSAGVRRLVDVRRFPGSRRHPHFSRAALEHSLRTAGLAYDWSGEEIGGRRKGAENSRHPAWRNRSFRAYADHMDTAEFRAALKALEEAAVNELHAIMCAETLWWHCHRRLIADALLLRGTTVVHLVSRGSAQEHVLNPAARSGHDGWPVYDLGVTPDLIPSGDRQGCPPRLKSRNSSQHLGRELRMNAHELRFTASALVAPGKGILAADESTPTLTKRLESNGIPATDEARRSYRSMLTTTPGASEQISGVILYDETIRQSTIEGMPFPEQLQRDGIICGIKVDTGAKDLAGAPGEKVTEGLDGLRDRLNEYRELGARFAKWRAVIAIGDGLPSPYCIGVNAHALARYAILCHEAGIVPIVEPEVLMDGDHTIERCYEVTAQTLHALFDELFSQRAMLDGMLLKANMVLPGKDCPQQVSVEEVAQETARCLRDVVPAAVPGIVFLSGGQSSRHATAHLNAMNNMGPHPWELSFSFARALQQPALDAWKGEESNFGAGQDAFHHRVKLTGLARAGKYTADMERS